MARQPGAAGMLHRSAISDDHWDAIWAEYDARQPAPETTPSALPAPRALRRSLPMSRWLGGAIGVATVVMLVLAWLAVPMGVAQEALAAVDSRDGSAFASRIDWAAVRPAIAASLARRADGEGLSPGARRYLNGMAGDMARAVETRPDALAGLLAARTDSDWSGGDSRATLPTAAIRAARPEGLTRFRVDLGPPDVSGGGLSLTIAPTPQLRWQVVAMEFSGD